eukprot:TRINITY_DN5738_c0_g1_i1.p1 TRINITY_DN5738_c0_g1~~TRINITY_DN5738_c0_g1_i1.p1  ORF type:complete len:154 (+),score=8.10 TRINITY_DN5738_c0_g1_i1:1114-1575(+)
MWPSSMKNTKKIFSKKYEKLNPKAASETIRSVNDNPPEQTPFKTNNLETTKRMGKELSHGKKKQATLDDNVVHTKDAGEREEKDVAREWTYLTPEQRGKRAKSASPYSGQQTINRDFSLKKPDEVLPEETRRGRGRPPHTPAHATSTPKHLKN